MHESSPTAQWGDTRGQGSPPIPSSAGLPGYRDTILAPVQQHTLAWKDGPRDDPGYSPIPPQFPRMGYPNHHISNSPGLPTSSQFTHRSATNTGHHNPTPPPLPPPLLSSESTAGSTSTASSGAYYSPRTPMDTHSGPSLNYFSQKKNGTYENQLPPLQTPSLSPQNTNLGPLPSPNTVTQSYQSLPPVRDLYTTTNYDSTPRRDLPPKDNLDILARAAELANKQGGPHKPQ